MISVILCDDHALIRRGIRDTLADASDIQVVGEAGDYAELRGLLRSLRQPAGGGRPVECDVLVLDINLPGRSGLDVMHALKDEGSTLKVLVVSMYPEDQYAVRSVKAGAAGYLHKNSPPETVIEAIRTVARGKKYITPELAEQLATHLSQGDERPPHELLSDREYQTMVMIASGRTLTQIAEEISLSPKTVSVYRARLLEKMKLKNNAELTHYALKHKLVE